MQQSPGYWLTIKSEMAIYTQFPLQKIIILSGF